MPRYIEDVLPLSELNKVAQKGGGIGSLNAMHPYFARRPLTASRAMTLAALVDAPQTETERQALEQLLVELSSEEWPEMPRRLVKVAHGGRAPRVLNPFAGGSSMPLEALRLGCDATALNLNPVAYLALIASLVYPQRYGQREILKAHADERRKKDTQHAILRLCSGQARNTLPMPNMESVASEPSQLVDDVRTWAEWVMAQAEAQIGDCYPVDQDGADALGDLWVTTAASGRQRAPRVGVERPGSRWRPHALRRYRSRRSRLRVQ